MITITELTSIPEEEFNELYASSIFALDNGTFDWKFVAKENASAEEKKEFIKSLFQTCIDKEDCIVTLFTKDNIPRGFYAGNIDGQYWNIYLGLYGSDANGSKSDLYSDVNHMESFKNFMYSKGLIGYKIECFKGEAIYNLHTQKQQLAYQTMTEESRGIINGKEVVILTFVWN